MFCGRNFNKLFSPVVRISTYLGVRGVWFRLCYGYANYTESDSHSSWQILKQIVNIMITNISLLINPAKWCVFYRTLYIKNSKHMIRIKPSVWLSQHLLRNEIINWRFRRWNRPTYQETPTFSLTHTAPNHIRPTGPSFSSPSKHRPSIIRTKPVLFESRLSTLNISATLTISASADSADRVEHAVKSDRPITHKFISRLAV
jgi:hypothetical protein